MEFHRNGRLWEALIRDFLFILSEAFSLLLILYSLAYASLSQRFLTSAFDSSNNCWRCEMKSFGNLFGKRQRGKLLLLSHRLTKSIHVNDFTFFTPLLFFSYSYFYRDFYYSPKRSMNFFFRSYINILYSMLLT